MSEATRAAAVGGKYKHSPFKLRVNVTDRGVFFDRVTDNDRLLVLHTTPRKARRLAQWILDNVEE